MPLFAQKVVRNSKGQVEYRVDKDGRITDANGKALGRMKDNELRDAQGRLVYKKKDNKVYDAQGRTVYRLSEKEVRDAQGRLVATKKDSTEIRNSNNQLKYKIK